MHDRQRCYYFPRQIPELSLFIQPCFFNCNGCFSEVGDVCDRPRAVVGSWSEESRVDKPGGSLVSHVGRHLRLENDSYEGDYALSLISPLIAALFYVLVEVLRPARAVGIWRRLWSWAELAVDPVEDRCENLDVQE